MFTLPPFSYNLHSAERVYMPANREEIELNIKEDAKKENNKNIIIETIIKKNDRIYGQLYNGNEFAIDFKEHKIIFLNENIGLRKKKNLSQSDTNIFLNFFHQNGIDVPYVAKQL